MKEMKEMLVLGEYLKDGKLYPSAKVVSREITQFSVLTAAGMLVTAYNVFESMVDENRKETFRKAFNEVFQKMMEDRNKYSFKIGEIDKPV